MAGPSKKRESSDLRTHPGTRGRGKSAKPEVTTPLGRRREEAGRHAEPSPTGGYRLRIGAMLAVTALALVWFLYDMSAWLRLEQQDAVLAEVESLNSVIRSDGVREDAVILRMTSGVAEAPALVGVNQTPTVDSDTIRLRPGARATAILRSQGTGGAIFRYQPLLGEARWIPRTLLSLPPSELWRSLLACLVGLLASAGLFWRSRQDPVATATATATAPSSAR